MRKPGLVFSWLLLLLLLLPSWMAAATERDGFLRTGGSSSSSSSTFDHHHHHHQQQQQPSLVEQPRQLQLHPNFTVVYNQGGDTDGSNNNNNNNTTTPPPPRPSNLPESGPNGEPYITNPNITEDRGSLVWVADNPAATGGGEESQLDGVTCFSADMTVEVLVVENHGTTTIQQVRMDMLKVGDHILTNLTSNGSKTYEKIYAFAHLNKDRLGDFLQVQFWGYHPQWDEPADLVLELSETHMVWTGSSYIPAKELEVGNKLVDINDDHEMRSIAAITPIQKQGIYAPLTKSGTIIVNGIAASTYTALWQHQVPFLTQQQYAHFGLSPFRFFCAVSSDLCNIYNDDGMPYYIQFSIWLSAQLDRQWWPVKFIYMVVFAVVLGTCRLLEMVVLEHNMCCCCCGTTILLTMTAVISFIAIRRRRRQQLPFKM